MYNTADNYTVYKTLRYFKHLFIIYVHLAMEDCLQVRRILNNRYFLLRPSAIGSSILVPPAFIALPPT